MKILDIITPHKALDEGLKQDAQELANKAGTKIRNTANDVGERFNIKWLRRPESQGVTEYIDNMLITAGKDLKRSPELAGAERALLDLEKTVKLDRAGKKQFEEIGDALADLLHARKESSLGGENPIDALQRMYRNSPNPPAWMSNTSLQLKKLNDEYCDWLTKSVDAKATARREVDLAKPADPTAVPKTKAEKEEEKIADKDRENRKKQTDLDAKKIDQAIADNDAAEKTFASRFKMTLADELFLGSEAFKIYLQWQRARNGIDDWEKAGKMPTDVASLFPEVSPQDLQANKTIVGGDSNDKRTYKNNEQRLKQAADWARTKIAKQVVYQLLGGGIAFVVAHGAVGLGGGVGGGASKYARAIKLINLMSKKSKSVTDPILKTLAGLSQAGKYMFVDYFLSAVNDKQWNSYDAAKAVNAVLPDYVYKDLNIEHTPDINKAVGSLVAENFVSLEAFGNTEFYKQVHGAVEASYVPLGVIVEPLAGVGAWIWRSFSLPDVRIPPAEGEIPGVGEPVKSQTSTQTNTVPPAENKPPENAEVTSTAPPPPVTVPPAKPVPKAKDKNPNASIYDMNESFKRTVARLMKS